MSNKNRALLFDVVFLSLICIFGEYINYTAVNKYSSGYYFSITLIMAFIAIYRLGYIGALTSIVIAVTFCVINDGATAQTFIVYIVGNSLILVAAYVLQKIGRERVRVNSTWATLYVLSGYLSIIIGRGVLSFILDKNTNLISALFLVLANEFLSIIAVVILFSLMTKQKTLLIDIHQLYDEAIEG